MNKIYQVYQVSDSTGETLDRIFLALKAQFSNFESKTIHYSFTRTKNQMDKIIVVSNHSKDVYKNTVATLPNHPDGRMQLSTPIEAINYASDSYWGDGQRFKFNAKIDTYSNTTELNQGEARIVGEIKQKVKFNFIK